MKSLILQIVCLMFISAIPLSSSYAQIDGDFGPASIKLNTQGIAETSLKIPANTKQMFSLDGKTFKNLEVKQLKGRKFKYELYKGKKRIASGYTTNSKINIKSDGRSPYYLSVIADDVILFLTLKWTELDQ